MMSIREGRLVFTFQTDCATQYDRWSFYRNQFQSVAGGSKAVDFLYLDQDSAWLIEATDYRRPTGGQAQPAVPKADVLAAEVAKKVRDTLAGLAAARKNANDKKEKDIAKKSMQKARWRVVLHLEQPHVKTKVRRQAIDPWSVKSELDKLLKAIDPRPVVMDRQSPHSVPWTVK